MKLIYVEDDPTSIFLFTSILSKISKDILDIAYNGRDGLEKIKNNEYDIIFSDIHMPIMCGITMAKEIRKYDLNTPIVFVTAYTDIINEFKKITPYVLAKPLDINMLIKIMENIKCQHMLD